MSFEILKSGGESTGSAEGYRRLQAEVQKEVASGHQVVLVVSAPAQKGDRNENRVTQLLRTTASGTDRRVRIAEIFSQIAHPLGLQFDSTQLEALLASAQREDDFLYLGEHLQAQQMAHFLDAQWVDARDTIITDGRFGAGKVVRVDTASFQTGKPVYVIGGFYGRSESGETVVLPGGGSDLTADVLAASLRAVKNVNLKEVCGIFAANPKYVPHAQVIRTLTYRELRELAYGGNAVLQEEAMAWSRKAGIPMRVSSLLHPENPGTRIVSKRETLQQPIVGIAAKDGFVIYIVKREDSPYFFPDLLAEFARQGVSVDMIGTENGIVSLAIEERELAIANNGWEILPLRYKFQRKENQALISVVGEGITGPLTLEERIVEVLDRNVGARYGPILGGRATSTTIYYIEKFGMNGEKGIAESVMRCFADKGAPITGMSTTIDSISVGTSRQSDSPAIEDMCAYFKNKVSPDSLSVSRNGLQRHGKYKVPSNVTVAVDIGRMEASIRKLYEEFF